MINEIIQKELKISDAGMRRLHIISGVFDICVFIFIWYAMLSTNPLAPCSHQFWVSLPW